MRLHRLHGGRGFKLQPAGCQELQGSASNYAHWIQGAKEQPIVPKRAIPILSINPELSLDIPHYGSYQVAVRRGATASAAWGAAGAAIFSLRGGDLRGRLAREKVVFTRRRQDHSASMNLPRVPAHVTVTHAIRMLLPCQEARRLRSELWEERSAAASAAVAAAGRGEHRSGLFLRNLT